MLFVELKKIVLLVTDKLFKKLLYIGNLID